MSIGGGGAPGDENLEGMSMHNQKLAKRMGKNIERIGKKLEKRGEKFWESTLGPMSEKMQARSEDLYNKFDEMDARQGNLSEMLGLKGESIQEEIDSARGFMDDLDVYKNALGKIGAAVEGISEEASLAYIDSREKMAKDAQQYEEDGRPIFGEYADSARKAADQQVGVQDKVSEAMGDVANAQARHKEQSERERAALGQNPNSSAQARDSMTFALSKAFAATGAKTQAENTNRALAVQGAGIMGQLNQAGQQLDKSAQNQQIGSGIRGQMSGLQGQQAGLVGQGTAITGQQANINSNVASLKGMQANIMGQQSAIESQRAGAYGQVAAISSQGARDQAGLQEARFSGARSALSAYSGVYQTSQTAATSAANANAKITSQEQQAEDAGWGKAIGTAASFLLV